MTKDTGLNILNKPEFLHPISEEAWRDLRDRFVRRGFKSGERIISQDEKDTQFFYIVASGRAEIFVDDENGYPLHLSDIYPGDYFGEKALLTEGESYCTVIAREDTEVYLLSREDFYQFLTEHPDLSRHFVWTLSQRLHRTNLVLEENDNKKTIIDLIFEESQGYMDAPFIVSTPKMREVVKSINQSAENSGPVLIEGEYGTGKQLIAWQIHSGCAKRKKAFIPLDCGALTEANWEEWLLGRSSDHPSNTKERSYGYIELAEGGTLFLKNCDQLLLPIQQKIKEIIEKKTYSPLKSDQPKKADFRLIAASRDDLKKKVNAGLFDPKLYELLSADLIKVPPLRDRKKDISPLVDYFISKYARLANKNITGITPEARNELLKHDFKLANVKELEQIIERGVPLTSDNQIWPRHLFLGAPAVEPDNWYYNLLKIKPLARWIMDKVYPDKLQYLTSIFFTLLILLCFAGPQNAVKNPAIKLVWGIWWPLMFLSFFWVGRTWCSICAYAAYARLLQKRKHFNIPLPSFIRKYDALFMTLAFLIILWVEEITKMRTRPWATGCLMLTMLSIALIGAMIFRRESWCRYLCPMGGLIGACSMTSLVELRSNPAVCSTQCKKTECYNGTIDSPGCPMFQHLLFVDNNQTCKLCLQCIRNCPNQSVSFNLRLPGREIWLSNQVRDKMAFFVWAMLGSALPVIYLTTHNLHLNSGQANLIFSLTHFLLPVLLGILLWLPDIFCSIKTRADHWLCLWRVSYAYVPLGLAAHIVYQLQYIPGGKYLHYFLQSNSRKLFHGPIIQPVQLTALLAGLFFSWFCLWQIYKHRQGKDFEVKPGFWFSHALIMSCYASVIFRWLILP